MLKNSIRNYVKQDEFKLLVKNNAIDIVNYSDLGNISEREIVIFNLNKKITITGSNLSINKLLNNEILILGKYNSIIFEGKNE